LGGKDCVGRKKRKLEGFFIVEKPRLRPVEGTAWGHVITKTGRRGDHICGESLGRVWGRAREVTNTEACRSWGNPWAPASDTGRAVWRRRKTGSTQWIKCRRRRVDDNKTMRREDDVDDVV